MKTSEWTKVEVAILKDGQKIGTISRSPVERLDPWVHREYRRFVRMIRYQGKLYRLMRWAENYGHLGTLEVGAPFIHVGV